MFKFDRTATFHVEAISTDMTDFHGGWPGCIEGKIQFETPIFGNDRSFDDVRVDAFYGLMVNALVRRFRGNSITDIGFLDGPGLRVVFWNDEVQIFLPGAIEPATASIGNFMQALAELKRDIEAVYDGYFSHPLLSDAPFSVSMAEEIFLVSD